MMINLCCKAGCNIHLPYSYCRTGSVHLSFRSLQSGAIHCCYRSTTAEFVFENFIQLDPDRIDPAHAHA